MSAADATLEVEAVAESFDEVSGCSLVYVPVGSVSIRQQDGLLSVQRRPVMIEGVTPSAAHALGLPEAGPYIRIWLAEPREGR